MPDWKEAPEDFAEKVKCATELVTPEEIEKNSGKTIKVKILKIWKAGTSKPQSRERAEIFAKAIGLKYSDLLLPLDDFIDRLAKAQKEDPDHVRAICGKGLKRTEILRITRNTGYQREKAQNWFEKVFKGYWYIWNNWLDIYEGKKTPVSVKSLLWADAYDKSTNTIRVQLTTRLWYTEGPSMRWTYAGWAILTDRKCYLILEDVQGSENEIMTIITNRPDYPVDTNTLYGLVLTTADDRKTKEAIPTATRVVLTKINTPNDEDVEEKLIEFLKEVDTYPREAFAGTTIGDSSMQDLVACELDQTNVLTYKMPEEALSRKR